MELAACRSLLPLSSLVVSFICCCCCCFCCGGGLGLFLGASDVVVDAVKGGRVGLGLFLGASVCGRLIAGLTGFKTAVDTAAGAAAAVDTSLPLTPLLLLVVVLLRLVLLKLALVEEDCEEILVAAVSGGPPRRLDRAR
jgi:hypothetical protein